MNESKSNNSFWDKEREKEESLRKNGTVNKEREKDKLQKYD